MKRASAIGFLAVGCMLAAPIGSQGIFGKFIKKAVKTAVLYEAAGKVADIVFDKPCSSLPEFTTGGQENPYRQQLAEQFEPLPAVAMRLSNLNSGEPEERLIELQTVDTSDSVLLDYLEITVRVPYRSEFPQKTLRSWMKRPDSLGEDLTGPAQELNAQFKRFNTFAEWPSARDREARIGDILHIDIGLIDKGDVMFTHLSPVSNKGGFFRFTTLKNPRSNPAQPAHPYSGSREYGFFLVEENEEEDYSTIKFYTRGMDQPFGKFSWSEIAEDLANLAQKRSWSTLLHIIRYMAEKECLDRQSGCAAYYEGLDELPSNDQSDSQAVNYRTTEFIYWRDGCSLREQQEEAWDGQS